MSFQDLDYQIFSSLRFDALLVQSSENDFLGGAPSPFYMLPYHRDRMVQAAKYFKWNDAVARIDGASGFAYILKTLEAHIDVKSSTPRRVKILLNHKGEMKIESSETPPLPLENLFPARIPPPAVSRMSVSPLTGGIMTLGDNDILITGSETRDAQKTQPWTVMVDPEKTRPSPFTTYKTTSRDMYNDARARVGINTVSQPKEVLIISNISDEVMEGSITSCFFWRSGRWVTPPISTGGQTGTTRRWMLEKGLCEEEAVSASTLVDGEECWISNGVRGLIWGKIRL